jgi:drug/metabolite transporter (DMT)-like permease
VDPLPFVLVLVSALMHAGWNLIAKRGRDGLVAMAMIKVPNILIATVVIAVMGWPALESWPYVLASACVNCLYFLCLINAYRVGDLGVAYPVSRGLAPILVLLLSLAWAREVPSAGTVVGVLVVGAGIVALAAQRDPTKRHGSTLLWASGVSACIATYTVTDGIGARVSGNPIAYVAVLNILTGAVLLSVALRSKRVELGNALREDWKSALLGGAMMLGSYTIVVFALTLAPMAQVAALRECSVIFAALLGTLFLHEPFGARRIAAAVVVAAGIGILVMAR